MASLTQIKGGDIVEVSVKGRHGYAIVTSKTRGKLQIRPITAGFTYREVTAHEVLTQFRRTKNVKKVGVKDEGAETSTGHSV